jgi:outer membrane protein OmpA-like peptidoglycan-associated protein/tetratricopeptide (TPR) repeat protein
MKKLVFILILFPFIAFSQNQALIKANKKYNNFEYLEAIKIYESIAKKGNGTPEIFENLANAYYNNANYAAANKWFAKLNEVNPNMSAESQYRYVLTLKSVGNNQEAEKQLNLYQKANPSQIRSKLLKAYKETASRYQFSNIQNLSINSDASDYGAFLKGDTLIFSSTRGQILSDRPSLRTGQSSSNLYKTTKGKVDYSEPQLYSFAFYSIYNDATPAFSNDGKTAYYTQNFLAKDSKKKLVNDGFKLQKAVWNTNKWVNQQFISFSQKDSVKIAHPALSPDGKFLYFSSDMPGTLGDSDLYKIALNEDGTFGAIEHLNDKINTEGRETFPFVTNSNMLIFSSNGHPGLGGLDLYSYDLNDPNAVVISLGAVINSPYDDFGLAYNLTTTKGFYSSNKPGAMGDDDIYSFDVIELTKPLIIEEPKLAIKGLIKDDVTNEALPNVNLVLVDYANKEIARSKTDENGAYAFNQVVPNTDYAIKVNKFDKVVRTIPVSITDKNVDAPITVSKNLVIPKVDITKVTTKSGVDVATALKIDQIYFDSNKYDIRPDAKVDLDMLVAYLKLNPNVNIEIGSHTDSIDTTQYNLFLSQKRAQSTLNYIVSEGVDPSRLIAVGYGESKLVNKCKDGVPCSKEQHQQNRRSTFIIR